MDDAGAEGKPPRQSLAGALAQRGRPSAFIGSRIYVDRVELEVVDIGPYTDPAGNVVTFLARPTAEAALQAGTILETAWGTCRVVE